MGKKVNYTKYVCYLTILSPSLDMVFLEAENVQGNLALLTHVDSFVVLVAIQGALLAVAALGLGVLALTLTLTWTSTHNPVVEPIKPVVRRC